MVHFPPHRRSVNPNVERCSSCGRVLRCAPAEGNLYVACCAFEVIEEGIELASFVGKLTQEWDHGKGDVAVWMLSKDCGPVLVATIIPVLQGGQIVPTVRWLS